MPDDIHTLSGAYAVDALDDFERAQFEHHLAHCPTCRSEVDSLREAAAMLAETTMLAPSAQLRERVLADAATVRPLPPVLGSRPAATAPADAPAATVTDLGRRRRRRVASFLAAAAAVVAIGGGGAVIHSVTEDGPRSPQSEVMAASDRETYTQHLDNGATAIIYRSKELDRAVLVTQGMPAAPSGHEYELWLLHGGTMVPAGVLPGDTDNAVVLSGDAATASGAGITVEDAGSQPTTPSDVLVANISFQNT